MVSWAVEVAAPSSSVNAGRTGRYRSIEMGPKTVSRSSSGGTKRPGRSVSEAWRGREDDDVEVGTGSTQPPDAELWEDLTKHVPAVHPTAGSPMLPGFNAVSRAVSGLAAHPG